MKMQNKYVNSASTMVLQYMRHVRMFVIQTVNAYNVNKHIKVEKLING